MQLEKLNVVAIGGGHGLGRVLSTLSFLQKKLSTQRLKVPLMINLKNLIKNFILFY